MNARARTSRALRREARLGVTHIHTRGTTPDKTIRGDTAWQLDYNRRLPSSARPIQLGNELKITCRVAALIIELSEQLRQRQREARKDGSAVEHLLLIKRGVGCVR